MNILQLRRAKLAESRDHGDVASFVQQSPVDPFLLPLYGMD